MHPLIPMFDPPAFELPIPNPVSGEPISIHGFGIMVALGVLLGAKVSMWKAARDGLDPEMINKVVTWLIVGIFVGGHLGHLAFYEPETLLKDPMSIFRVWSGLSSYGGFLACTIATVIFFRLYRLNFWAYGDTLAVGLQLGWALGRVGCFVAHDHIGISTDFWLGVRGVCPGYEGDASLACHDLGLYEALYSGLFLLPLFLWLDRKPRFPGFFIGLMALAYGPVRFVMDAFRHPATDTRYYGFTPAQFGSIIVGLLGVWILVSRRNVPPVVIRAGKAEDAPASPA